MTKIFSKDTLLSIDGFIYLVDKTLNHREGVCVCLDEIRSNAEHGVELGDKMYVDPIVYKSDNCGGCVRIMATNNPSLEGVAKILELEEVWDKDRQIAFSRLTLRDWKDAAIDTGSAMKLFNAGYKAASSKKKYTEDEMRSAFKAGKRRKNWELTIKDERLESKDTEEYIQSLKPSPISIEIEMLEWEKSSPDKEDYEKVYLPKLKDGYVIIKEVKYE
jgi:hypothetical protein